MATIVKYIFSPVVAIKRRFNRRHRSSLLDHPPPPVDVNNNWEYGSYCWIATVEAKNEKDEVDRTFIGYSQNMDITKRTSIACDRYKLPGTTCGEATMSMRGGECDEVIFMRPKNGKMINLTSPFH